MALIPRSQSSGGVGVNQVFQTGESKNTFKNTLLGGVEEASRYLTFSPEERSLETEVTSSTQNEKLCLQKAAMLHPVSVWLS